MIISPTYNKFFKWNKMYEFKYDITRTLKLDFAVNSKANIDEPYGRIDKSDPLYRQKMDTIWNNFWNSGRPTSYNQTMSVNYQFPLNKIPLLNFMSLTTRYNGNYNWQAAPLALNYLGNTIQNSQSRQYNGQINLTTLYNKVPYFKRLNKGKNTRGRPTRKNTKEEDPAKEDKFEFFKHLTRFALGVKNLSFSFSQNRGTLLPGYLPDPNFLGQEWSSMAPTIPFVLGSQKDIRNIAGSSGWITQDTSLNTLYKQNTSTNLTLRSTIEPIKQFRIELNASKITSSNNQEYFRWDNINNGFNSFSPTESGSYSISFISLPTAFTSNNDDYSSSTFAKFRGYRADIANRLASENPNFNGSISPVTGFPVEYSISNGDTMLTGGYGSTSQEVMIPAFLAAYGGKSSLNASLNQMPVIPLPNWRITYDGLVKIKSIKKYFKTFSLAHSYRSTYSVSSYITNLDYINGDEINMNNMSYHVQKQISQVSINEQFSPLFKLDMLWKNSLITKIEIKSSRMLSLSLSNNQLTETNTKDYVIGTGFRLKDVEFRFISGGRGKKMSSDLDLKLDLNIRNNKTIIRKVIEDVEQITMGQQIISIKFSADYVLNQRLNIKAFYDKVITNPFISTTFPGSITNAGFSLRFTLAG